MDPDTTSPPTELEIKLRIPPGAEAALEAHPVFQGADAPEIREEVTTYFDTPGRDLARQGALLAEHRLLQAARDVSEHAPLGRRREAPLQAEQRHDVELELRALGARVDWLDEVEVHRAARRGVLVEIHQPAVALVARQLVGLAAQAARAVELAGHAARGRGTWRRRKPGTG